MLLFMLIYDQFGPSDRVYCWLWDFLIISTRFIVLGAWSSRAGSIFSHMSLGSTSVDEHVFGLLLSPRAVLKVSLRNVFWLRSDWNCWQRRGRNVCYLRMYEKVLWNAVQLTNLSWRFGRLIAAAFICQGYFSKCFIDCIAWGVFNGRIRLLSC